MRVTVAICTWNRARSLDRTLKAFAALRLPAGVTWELIVVNNNSSDDTDQVIAAHAGRLPVRGITEKRPGKSYAANAAIAAATGELILWTDDDVLVDPEFLAAYVTAANAHPQAAFFGGTVEPLFEGHTPAWIERHVEFLSEVYALARYGAVTEPLRDRNIVGANMAIRTAVARQYPFDVQLGPNGEKPLRGEDTELVGRLRGAGLFGLWVGGAKVLHCIGAERLNADYLWHWYAGLGTYTIARGGGVVDAKRLFGAPRWALKQYAVLLVKCSVLGVTKNDAWIRTLRQAGLMKGYLDEARRLHALSAASGRPRAV